MASFKQWWRKRTNNCFCYRWMLLLAVAMMMATTTMMMITFVDHDRRPPSLLHRSHHWRMCSMASRNNNSNNMIAISCFYCSSSSSFVCVCAPCFTIDASDTSAVLVNERDSCRRCRSRPYYAMPEKNEMMTSSSRTRCWLVQPIAALPTAVVVGLYVYLKSSVSASSIHTAANC